jgi:hypothetical protein
VGLVNAGSAPEHGAWRHGLSAEHAFEAGPPAKTASAWRPRAGELSLTASKAWHPARPTTLHLLSGATAAVKVEVVWPEKVRKYELPFSLKDVEIIQGPPVRLR